MKKIIYGKRYAFYKKYDIALNLFDNSDFIENRKFFKKNLPGDFEQVIEFLEKEGMLVFEQNGVRITALGRFRIASGGYVRILFKELIVYLSIIIGILSGIVGIIAFAF